MGDGGADGGPAVFQWQPYSLLPSLAVLLGVGVAGYAARHRSATPAANAIMLVAVGLGLWAAEDAVGGFLTDVGIRTDLALIRFPAMKAATLGLCWFCWILVNGDRALPRWLVFLVLTEPVLVTLAAATNPWHHWLIAATELVGRPSMLRIHVGPLFYVHSAYNYALIAVTLVWALRGMRTASQLQRRQLGTIIVASVFPVIGNIVTLVQFAQGGGGDYAVLGFSVSGLLTGYAAFRQGLLRIVPIARGLVLDRVGDAVLVLDRNGRVLDLNRAAGRLIETIHGNPADAAIGRPMAGLLVEADGQPWPADGEYTTVSAGGRIDLDIRATELRDRRGGLMGRVVVARDVTESNEQKRALRAALRERDGLAEELRHQALHDNLTGLPNRALFAIRLSDEYARARRDGVGTVVMFIDLDNFKPVNDGLGHHAGDLLLQQVAARLTDVLGGADTVARLGGDEFAVILAHPLPGPAQAVAARLVTALREPFLIHGERVQVGASIGVAVDRDASGEPDQLLRDADAAMYQAKRRGKGAFAVIEQSAAADYAAPQVRTGPGSDGRGA